MSRRTRSNVYPRARHLRRRMGVRRLVIVVAILVAGLVAGPTPIVPGAASASLAEGGFAGPASSANARYIAAVYQQLLGRTADTGGLDFHLGRIAAGGDTTRERLTRSLLFSEEGSRAEVVRAYAELLGRGPDAGGATYWTEHLRSHGVVDLRVLLLASEEYHSLVGGRDEAWIDALYLEVLRRPAEPSGRTYWLGQLNAGVPRVLVAAGIHLSGEALGHRADSYYREALGRPPTSSERSGAVSIMRALGERGLRARLWASDEAFEPHLVAATVERTQP